MVTYVYVVVYFILLFLTHIRAYSLEKIIINHCRTCGYSSCPLCVCVCVCVCVITEWNTKTKFLLGHLVQTEVVYTSDMSVKKKVVERKQYFR